MAGFDLPPGSRIIDVSQAQTPINWQAVKAAGIVGVMVRATQGVRESVPVGVDTAFVGHVEGALAAGLRVGAYHAYIPHRDPVEQALFFAAVTAPYHERLTLGYAIDAELDYSMDAAVITYGLYQLARALASGLDTKPIIYTSLNFWTNHVLPTYDSYFGTLPLWVAAWGTESPKVLRGWQSIWLHQFGKETVDGQEIDMNRIPAVSSKPFTLQLPVAAPARVTQRFYDRPEYYKPLGLPYHSALDYGVAEGTPVYASADGIVSELFKDDGKHLFGNFIRIRHNWHNDVYVTSYAHLRGFVPELQAGDTVHAGKVIGYSGNTGNSSAPHVHFQLTKNGKLVDPLLYLKA